MLALEHKNQILFSLCTVLPSSRAAHALLMILPTLGMGEEIPLKLKFLDLVWCTVLQNSPEG